MINGWAIARTETLPTTHFLGNPKSGNECRTLVEIFRGRQSNKIHSALKADSNLVLDKRPPPFGATKRNTVYCSSCSSSSSRHILHVTVLKFHEQHCQCC